MNNEFLLLIKKPSDTLIKQSKTKPQEISDFVMDKQMQTFSFNPSKNLSEEGKCLSGVTLFECTNPVFNVTDESNSFSINIPGHYQSKSAEKTINELFMLLEFKSLELHVKEFRKSGNQIKIGNNEYKLSDFDTQKFRYLKN